MSIVDDIQLILNLLQQHKNTANNWESINSPTDKPSLEHHFHKLSQEYESLRNVAVRAGLTLMAARDELQESKQKIYQTEQQLQAKKSELHTALQVGEKMQQKIAHFQKQEQSLRQEISHLHLLLSQKEKQVQQREEFSNGQTAQLRDENALLHQHIEDICIKYKNLEIIAQQQATRRQKLQEEIQMYRKQEKQLESSLNGLTSQLNIEMHARTALQREIKERQAKMHDLEGQLIDSAPGFTDQFSDYEIKEDGGINEEQMTQIPTEVKFLQLSQQISSYQKTFINLNLQNSFEGSQDNPKVPPVSNQARINQLFKLSEEREGKFLRKVASNVELSSRKRIIPKQSIILRDLQDDKSQDPSSKEAKINLNSITNRAELRLKDLYKLNSHMIIETQGTERECDTDRSMLREQDKPLRRAESLLPDSLADPYYIHYQLTVQSIKIEEDEDGVFGILEIDMKPYYRQLVTSKLPLSRWNDWIRQKLLQISNIDEQGSDL